jgi:hypothetical protein
MRMVREEEVSKLSWSGGYANQNLPPLSHFPGLPPTQNPAPQDAPLMSLISGDLAAFCLGDESPAETGR